MLLDGGAKITGTERDRFKRGIKETLKIRKKSSMGLDGLIFEINGKNLQCITFCNQNDT